MVKELWGEKSLRKGNTSKKTAPENGGGEWVYLQAEEFWPEKGRWRGEVVKGESHSRGNK